MSHHGRVARADRPGSHEAIRAAYRAGYRWFQIDVVACRELGVDAIGINLWAGSRRGLTLAEATALVRELPARGGPERVGVFVNPEPDYVLRAHAALGLDLVQIVSDDPHAAALRLALPQLWVVQIGRAHV